MAKNSSTLQESSEHEIKLSVKNLTVGYIDWRFEISRGGAKLGELKISQGDIEWKSKNAQKTKKLPWGKFADIMDEATGSKKK